MECTRTDTTLSIFYRTERVGAARLSDGGGPFGFDVTVALLVDDLLQQYHCDAIVETGCFLGDTASYLTRRYPQMPVYACDIDPSHVAFTRHRLAGHHTISVECVDSPALVAQISTRHQRPLFYLDAHWAPQWPLERELAAITTGLVVIHDFDIGHPRFSYDSYDGIICGPAVLARMPSPPARYYTPDPEADHPLPCLQTGRRAGVGILAVGLDPAQLEAHPHLLGHDLVPDPAKVTP